MNIKITKEQHERLCKTWFKEYIFGSQLHGIATENSDEDYIRLYLFDDVFPLEMFSMPYYLPNIHSFQYDDVNNDKQYVWMSEEQFWRNLWSGDGNMVADVVLLSGEWGDPLHLCRTYKICKAYLGVAKRDLKLHGGIEKKCFHAYRSLMMAEKLMDNVLPTVQDIIDLKASNLPSTDVLKYKEGALRDRLNLMYNNGEILSYPKFEVDDTLLGMMFDSNNIKEFKYEQ